MGNFTNSDYVLVDNMASELITLNTNTTNLDIKNALRKAFPGSWVQQTISDVMVGLSDVEGKYIYVVDRAYDADGIMREFRRYSLPVQVLAGDDEDDDIVTTIPSQTPITVAPPPLITIDITDVTAHNTNITNADLLVPVDKPITSEPTPVVTDITNIPKGSILHRLRRVMGGK